MSDESIMAKLPGPAKVKKLIKELGDEYKNLAQGDRMGCISQARDLIQAQHEALSEMHRLLAASKHLNKILRARLEEHAKK